MSAIGTHDAARWLQNRLLSRHLFLLFLLCSAAALRCYEIGLPYIKLHEAGFQEALALNHLEHGIFRNRFLSVMAVVDSVTYHHVSHPPLLQYILAVFFWILGASEAVARLAILPFSVGTVFLTYAVASKQLGDGIARIAALFVTFSLLSSYFSRIVNFEVLAQFFVLLYYLQFLRYREDPTRSNLLLLTIVCILGCLSDWPFYFVLGGMVLFIVLDRRYEKWLQGLGVSLLLLGLGFIMVTFYAWYQDTVTGTMVLTGHGRNRAAPGLLVDPAYYKLIMRRLFEYAPFLSILAPTGLLVCLGRGRGALAAIAPLLLVPLAYMIIFADLVRLHEFSLYYFAVPFSILAAITIDWSLGERKYLRLATCGFLIASLGLMNLQFHQEAKRGIFSDLYNLSSFLRNHLPQDTVVFSGILCQLGYYLEDTSEVIFRMAKGDLSRHAYDCYVADRLKDASYLRRVLGQGIDKEGYRRILESSRYELACRQDLMKENLLLRDGPVETRRLKRFGRAVHVAKELPISYPGRMKAVRVPGIGPACTGEESLSFRLGLVGTPALDLLVWSKQIGERVEILHRSLEPGEKSGEWRPFEVDAEDIRHCEGEFEFAVVTTEEKGVDARVYLGDPRTLAGKPPGY